MKPLLTTTGLTIGYSPEKNPIRLQENINVTLNGGEIISLMGQNGVGKTTFIKTISGLLPPVSGEIKFGETSLQQLGTEKLAKKLSVVLTEKPSALNLTVLELITLGRQPYSSWLGMLSPKDKQAIDQAINDTKINYIAHKKLFELSDGQLQKAMIARALAQETEIILLDEPASHLDLPNKIEVMMLLRQIANSGKGVLISTHDLQISNQLSDRLWLFNFNQPMKSGLPEDLILNGELEKTLYLQGYGYDMTTGMIQLSEMKNAISVIGENPALFWTVQALKRNGYRITENANLVVSIKEGKWNFLDQQANSVGELLHLLKNQLNDSIK